MSYFASATYTQGNCTDAGCTITLKWSLAAGASFDLIEIYRDPGAGSPAELLAQVDGKAKEQSLFAYYANFNNFRLTPRTVANGQTQQKTKLPGGGDTYFEDPALSVVVSVNLPAPAPEPGKSFKPNKPSITDLVVEDGSLFVKWRSNGGADIDAFTVAIVENGVHLAPIGAGEDARSARFSPTKAGATYDIGVSAGNDVLSWPEFWTEKRFSSDFDWRRVQVPEKMGWPPNGQWQSFAFQGSGFVKDRDALTAVSRAPNIMDVFFVAPLATAGAVRMGKVRTGFYRDGAGWGYADLPFPPSADYAGPMTSVSRKRDLVEIWWTGLIGTIQHAYWYPDTGWKYEQFAGPLSIAPEASITSISRSENHMEVFWIAPNGAIRHAYWYEGQPWRFGEISGPGSGSVTGGITACSRIPGHMEIFWIGPDGSIQHAWWFEGQNWQRGELQPRGAALPSARIASLNRNADNIEVYYVGANMSLKHSFWYPNEGWRHNELTPAGAVSPLSAVAAVSREPGTIEVFWVSIFGELRNCYWYTGRPGDGWGLGTLSGRFSAGYAVAAVSRQPNTIELWSSRADGSIDDHYIYWK